MVAFNRFGMIVTHSVCILLSNAAIYLTLLSLPYLAWNISIQVATEAREALLIVGDILCLIPPVAFQIGIGSVMAGKFSFLSSAMSIKELE